MAVTLTASNTSGFVSLGFPDESGGVVGSQTIIGIPQYNMIVKYDLKGYSDQALLPDEQQTLMDASIEALDGVIVLNFKKFLLEEWENDIILTGLAWGFLTLLSVGADFFTRFPPPLSHLVQYL